MCFGMSDVCLSSGATNFEALDCNYMWITRFFSIESITAWDFVLENFINIL
jgi:hypothetical protein